MARSTEAKDQAMLDAQPLIANLQVATTSADLWRIGGTEEFKAEFAALSEGAQTIVRETFEVLDTNLKGKIKAADVAAMWDEDKQQHTAGVVLRIPPTGWDFPAASPRFPNSKFVVLKGTREDTGEHFEMVIGAARVVRHFERAAPVMQRIMLVQETPDEMKERSAKADTSPMWLVRQLSGGAPVSKRNAGTPFG